MLLITAVALATVPAARASSIYAASVWRDEPGALAAELAGSVRASKPLLEPTLLRHQLEPAHDRSGRLSNGVPAAHARDSSAL